MTRSEPYRPPEWDETEKWMAKLGAGFVDVWFLTRDGAWTPDPQVDDHDTFLECVSMAFSRHDATYALWSDDHAWCLLSNRSGDTRSYPTREAAEMVAIHHG